MFELLVNLMLTSLFLTTQANQQTTIDNLINQEYRLPQAEIRSLAQEAPQREILSDSLGVDVSAQSVLVVDEKTSKVLYDKNPQEKRSIASLTKLMTALVFLDYNPGWDSQVKILESDYRDGAIKYLINGEVVSTYDLLHTSLISSSNEATVALARSTGLSHDDFVKKMNEKAKQLDMNNTSFSEVTGLSNSNKSTANDIIILARTAFSNKYINQITGTESYTLNVISSGLSRNIKSTDKILNQEFGLGGQNYKVKNGKTGYLEAAGYNFVSLVSDSNNRKILVAVLGSSTTYSRFTDTKSLAYWVFNNYNW